MIRAIIAGVVLVFGCYKFMLCFVGPFPPSTPPIHHQMVARTASRNLNFEKGTASSFLF